MKNESMIRVILLHGKHADPNQKWYPWFVLQMRNRNILIDAPKLPDSDNPNLHKWLKVIDELNPDEDTILVGHSMGGVGILRWLEKQKDNASVRKVILYQPILARSMINV